LYICICNAVTRRQVEECAHSGITSLDELAFELGVGAGCGRCRECAAECLQACGAQPQSRSPA
jgi:bacterioferritin-associated ferredoxin